MALSGILFPRMFEPLAPVVALFTTAAILSDAFLDTSAFEPLFFCYLLSGLYLISMVFEVAWVLRGDQDSGGSLDDE